MGSATFSGGSASAGDRLQEHRGPVPPSTGADGLLDRLAEHCRGLRAAFLAAAGRGAGPLLRAGRVRLTGTAPNGQDFAADLRRVWTIEDSTAIVNGTDLGSPGPTASQEHLGDFWLPQRGIFGIVDAFFEPYDPARHEQVATRGELHAAGA